MMGFAPAVRACSYCGGETMGGIAWLLDQLRVEWFCDVCSGLVIEVDEPAVLVAKGFVEAT